MRGHPDPRTRGATLTDVLAGIGITLVVMGMAVPNLRAFAAPYTLDTAARVIASEFATARMRAIAQNRRHRINFHGSSNKYSVQAEVAPGVFADVGPTQTPPDGIDIEKVDVKPIFDTRGMLTAAISIDVQGPHAYRTVSVNMLGDVDISDAVAGSPEVVPEGTEPTL